MKNEEENKTGRAEWKRIVILLLEVGMVLKLHSMSKFKITIPNSEFQIPNAIFVVKCEIVVV